MKHQTISLLIACVLLFAVWSFGAPVITPKPRSVSCGVKTLTFKNCIQISYSSSDSAFEADLIELYSPLLLDINKDFKFESNCQLRIDIKVKYPEIMKPQGIDKLFEKYVLKISDEGAALIEADYKIGVIRAMDTLAQLFEKQEDGIQISSLPIEIEDEPRYGYRGLMLDISREFYPIPTLKKVIDGLRMTKINYLHLHLSDDDSCPVQFASFPGLSNYTALSSEEVYSKQDIIDIIQYASKSGISVIPEIDLPGHTKAFGRDPNLRKLLTCYDRICPWSMPDKQKIFGGPSSSVLNPTLNQTYEFIGKLSGDIFDLFKDSDFYHFGGDEVNFNVCWESDPSIQKFMNEHNIKNGVDLFTYFTKQISDMMHNSTEAIHKSNRTTSKPLAHWVYDKESEITWDKGSVLQYWGASANITRLIEKHPDHKHILSPQDFFYFDCGTGNRYGSSLCNPYQTWANIRTFEPTKYYKEGDDQLLGGEACMWSELVTPYITD